jgi:hypothetical protein
LPLQLPSRQQSMHSSVYVKCSNTTYQLLISYRIPQVHDEESLTLNKSSRVIPGFRGTPAGTKTIWAPSKAFSSPSPSGK